MNDGVIILVSDMNEEALKKLLINYVGGFKTRESAFRRPSLRYQPVSGWSTYEFDGKEESIDVVMSVAMPLTMDNYVTAAVAARVLEKGLATVLAETGMFPKVSYNFQISPQERLSMMISVGNVSKMGYASHIEHSGPMEALAILRSSLQNLDKVEIPANIVEADKAYMKNLIAQKMNDPKYWVDAIAKRYVDGKDFSTSYQAKIDAVNADKVKLLILALNSGSKVEFVVK